MCGIVGFIDHSNKSDIATLQRMIATLHHRGPDGNDISVQETQDGQVGLAHSRLAIIDLSDTGRQPMHYNDLSLTFNGEIYNYREIKLELEKLGHKFHSSSDSEVILHAYEEWGKECLSHFIGMFAFVIFDSKEKLLFAARDRAGVKPFFLYRKEELVLFASELKAFHEHPNFEKDLNIDAVAAFMQYGHVPTPHCIFNHCQKLNPGHYFVYDLRTKDLIEKEYWNVYDHYNKPKLNISFEDGKKELKTLLRSAFEYRMVADVPVGVFLSGGFDSASVTALLQSDRTERLKTYTIGVPDIGLNEAPYAKEIAEHLGTDHTEINCTEEEAIELIKDLPYYYDEPFADSSAIPTTLVSKMARKEVTVALSADGGDETFAGYNRYDYFLRYGKKLNKIPGFARKSAASIMNSVPSERIPLLKNKYNFHNRYEKLKGVLRDPSDTNIMLSLSQQYTDDQIRKFMKQNNASLDTMYTSNALKSEFYTPLSYMMAIDYQTYMLDDILQKVDRATMTASLEGREPLLDHRIIEYAAQLPDEFKYQNGVKKHILREIVYDYIPKEMMERPKMGFAIPVAKWLSNDLRDLVEEYCSEQRLKEHDLFDLRETKQLLDRFFNGKKEYDYKIWYLLMFQMWYDKWMKTK
jgi:asparagine synthase (glutamine-hydrolysing)